LEHDAVMYPHIEAVQELVASGELARLAVDALADDVPLS
jgi:hypothetical protein